MKFFEAKGSTDLICCELANELTDGNIESAKTIFDFIVENQRILDNDEIFEGVYQTLPAGVIGLMTCDGNYHINVKIATIVIVALLLDITLTNGVASTALGFFGVSSKAITKLSEYEAEKCIVQETLFQKDKQGNKKILERMKGKCCNCHFKCKYRSGDNCKCTEDNVYSIYQKLVKEEVFEESGECFEFK